MRCSGALGEVETPRASRRIRRPGKTPLRFGPVAGAAVLLVRDIAPINEYLLEQCGRVHPDPKPLLIPCRPFGNAEYATCYFNVQRCVEAFGGTFVLGYSLWANKAVLDFEAHAVWLTPESELVCVTPQMLGEREILFLETARLAELPDSDTFHKHHLSPNRFFAQEGSGRSGALCAEAKENAANAGLGSAEARYWDRRADFYLGKVETMPANSKELRKRRKQQRQAKKRNR